MQRYFNTSGPNIPYKHYTLLRDNLIQDGIVKLSSNISKTLSILCWTNASDDNLKLNS